MEAGVPRQARYLAAVLLGESPLNPHPPRGVVMTEKRYRFLERVVETFLATLALAGIGVVLLGVYALAGLVF